MQSEQAAMLGVGSGNSTSRVILVDLPINEQTQKIIDILRTPWKEIQISAFPYHYTQVSFDVSTINGNSLEVYFVKDGILEIKGLFFQISSDSCKEIKSILRSEPIFKHIKGMVLDEFLPLIDMI